MRNRKALYKLVRASSLQIGDSVIYRLKDDEIPQSVLISLKDRSYRGSRARKFMKNPYRLCEIRQILSFGSFYVFHLRRRSRPDLEGFIYHTLMVKPDSYQGLYAGSTEGVLP